MTSDLRQSLHVAAAIAGPNARKLYLDAAARIADLEDAARAVVEEYPVSAGTAKGLVEPSDGYGSIRRLRYALAASEPEA